MNQLKEMHGVHHQKRKKGISLISLIITIIVIIILAAVVLFTGLGAPDSANFAKYTQEVDNFQMAVQEEYATRTTKYSVNDQSRSDAQVYYTIATGNEVEVNTKTESLRAGTIEELGLALKPTGLDGNEYFEITPNTSIAGKKDNKGLYQALGTAEKHYITDRGEFFVLPGYRYYDAEGKSKWYVTAGKYYESEEGISGPLNLQISEVKITKDSAGTEEVTGTLEKGTDKAYISFTASIQGGTAEISPAVPYEISDNGEYTFTITANVDGTTKTVPKTVSVSNMFVQMTDGSIFDFVSYSGVIKGLKSEYYTLNGSAKIVPDELCELNIPSKINGKDVLSINKKAFENYTNITSVSIPSSISTLEDETFKNCTKLNSITLPTNLSTIKKHVFDGCSSLTGITIPNNVTSIGEYSFWRCTNLNNVRLPSNITRVEEGTFSSCSNLESIVIPDNVTYIGSNAFNSCTNLENIILPEGVQSIGNRTFYNCKKIENMVLPSTITNIDTEAFYGCNQLTNLSIPSGVTNIGSGAFRECYNLNNVVIPEGITQIGQFTFYYCKELTNITIPSSVKKIELYAFSGCTNLTEVNILNGLESIGQLVFASCSKLEKITIPLTLKTVTRDAFDRCSNLRDVYYAGTEEQWNEIEIGTNNYRLTTATRHYNSSGPSS